VSVRTTERCRSPRGTAAHAVVICDHRGRTLVRGRTAEVSAGALTCLTRARRALRIHGEVILDVDLPAGRSPRLRHSPLRTVRYAGRVVETTEIGQLVSLTIELIERLG